MGGPPFGEALTPTDRHSAQFHFARPRLGQAQRVSFDSPRFAATVRPMKKSRLPLLLAAAALCLLPACASRKSKSSAHMYSGDAPTIKYSDKPESAGGRMNTY